MGRIEDLREELARYSWKKEPTWDEWVMEMMIVDQACCPIDGRLWCKWHGRVPLGVEDDPDLAE